FRYSASIVLQDIRAYTIELQPQSDCLIKLSPSCSTQHIEVIGPNFARELLARKQQLASSATIRPLFDSQIFTFNPFFGIYELSFTSNNCLVFRVTYSPLIRKFSGPTYHSCYERER
ncbi:hypothetical protein EHQ12_16165, partial [Leptospira gomenensis]